MPDLPAPPSISNAEWEVMKVLWDKGPLAARDVFEGLPAGHGWAYKTVKTLLARLVAKGALTYEQIGNSYLYKALYGRDQVTAKEVRGFVDRVLDGSSLPVLAHFIENQNLSPEEIARLQQMLEEKGRRDTGKSRERKR